ncbi:hypothetical protein [uncultured Desulfovibrio sp.]|uniref:hypothetical protein n=1 Tax=uncultured Desulfovibrio sp. TaxID=167968 RepID=UPI0026305560|nr:hypothetical protein [uncultured Desulfovibrio sp.]
MLKEIVLKRRLRALPVLKVFHEVELTRMERIGFVFALSMTALPVCGLVTGVAGIVPTLLLLFPKGCLASLVVHLVIYGFYRVARKHPTAREWWLVEFLGDKEPFGVVLRLTLSAIVTLGCIVLTLERPLA